MTLYGMSGGNSVSKRRFPYWLDSVSLLKEKEKILSNYGAEKCGMSDVLTWVIVMWADVMGQQYDYFSRIMSVKMQHFLVMNLFGPIFLISLLILLHCHVLEAVNPQQYYNGLEH